MSAGARTANIEGYLAFGFMLLLYTSDWWYGRVDHPGPPEIVVGVSLSSLWLLSAVSGARRARGLARAAAVVALTVFGVQAAAILAVVLVGTLGRPVQ